MATWTAGFTQLTAWQVAYQVGLEVYDLACGFPHPHRFALAGQLQRAAISLPTNVAEGFGRRHGRDKARFYEIAHASGDELKCLLFFARDKKLCSLETFESLMTALDRACRLIYRLMEGMEGWQDP